MKPCCAKRSKSSGPSAPKSRRASRPRSAKFASASSAAAIFLAQPANVDAPAIAALRAQAGQLATQARSGDFAALAKAHSQDPRSAAQGGEVGALPLAQMLPEMRESVARLKPGQVSEPVQSAAGFHVLKLLAVQPARVATLDESRPRLQAAMRTQRRQELANEVFARLAPAGSIRIDSAALDAVLQKFN
ncbi:Foldase protein PrsA 3 precursor [compost metagenome]